MTKRSEDQKPGIARIDAGGGSACLIASAGPGSDHVRGVLDGVVQMKVAMAREVLHRKGVNGPAVDQILDRLAAEFRVDFERERRGKGIAPHIVQLLGAPSRHNAERLARSMAITPEEFADLMFNAHAQLGYRHRMKWREFLPDHLEGITGEVSEALRGANPGPASADVAKAMRKVEAIFNERKRVHVHMLERGAKWHAFFFDLNDVSDLDQGPGPHLHYVSHHWGIDRETVWRDFDERRQSTPRRVHIRFVDERIEQAERERRQAKSNRMSGPGHVLANDESGVWFLPGK